MRASGQQLEEARLGQGLATLDIELDYTVLNDFVGYPQPIVYTEFSGLGSGRAVRIAVSASEVAAFRNPKCHLWGSFQNEGHQRPF
jgi:hypothetical protein